MTRKFNLSRRSLSPALEGPGPGITEHDEAVPDRAAQMRRIFYWSLVALAAALMISLQPVFASSGGQNAMWTQFSAVMRDIYSRLLGISTIVGVTAATIALLVRMISRNQRAVDEATQWLKRITITWIILNTLGFIIAYISPWIQGGQWTP